MRRRCKGYTELRSVPGCWEACGAGSARVEALWVWGVLVQSLDYTVLVFLNLQVKGKGILQLLWEIIGNTVLETH